MNKKVLVAIDGSVYSLNSIDYLIRLFHDDKSFSLHLFAVVSQSGAGQNWMYEVDPHREHTPLTEQRRITAEKYLRDAKARLMRNGFSEEQISFEAHITGSQIALAVHHEANEGGYDALLIRKPKSCSITPTSFSARTSWPIRKIFMRYGEKNGATSTLIRKTIFSTPMPRSSRTTA
jgi:hypothetical protein